MRQKNNVDRPLRVQETPARSATRRGVRLYYFMGLRTEDWMNMGDFGRLGLRILSFLIGRRTEDWINIKYGK